MLNIHLRSTGERFTLQTIHFDTKVRELKTILEIICGIPAHLQLLSYLDEGTLVDSQKLKYYDPVPNCTFELDVWFIYEPIVQAVVANNEAKLFELGVLPDVPFSSAIADRLSPSDKQAYILERGSVAMFTAAHRERLNIVRHLCERNVGINYQTAAGRTPLMVATARGSLRVMELLLHHGARLDIRDAYGQTAESFSIIFNQKQSRRTIIQFNWKRRNAKSLVREREAKLAMSRQTSKNDQAVEEANRQREERLACLADQRKKRQEQITAQQLRLRKKKSPQTQTNQRTSIVRFEDDDNEQDSDNYDRSPERISMTDSSLVQAPSSLPPISQQSSLPTQKLFAHQFYDVYAGMTDDEWIKVRNAFVAQYFSE
ncbi:unnamed protein product [Rotaria sordida]|uniref:Uncharacterized protein n=1 Tax=Rotaria sordida TaxID=392033 RepID=A0A814EV76_9BILA|nr:unnamed protein product [Rotaria sordida]CAF1403659.1 unnamed protein product [Rotaria sordida]CAF1625363.1 unnamed protein product [Rotaria sordida]CAF3841761.1 unnamed protein product [Rotaria sordida]